MRESEKSSSGGEGCAFDYTTDCKLRVRRITPPDDELYGSLDLNLQTKALLTDGHESVKQQTMQTIQKPFNSPMLIASAASVSASSPASGDIVNELNQAQTDVYTQMIFPGRVRN